MSIEIHNLYIGQSFFAADDGNNITAECSCGWEGRRRYYCVDDARDAWDDHCDQVFIEATTTDPGCPECSPEPHQGGTGRCECECHDR